MSTVSWTTLDPNVCEDMVAVLMCRENLETVRVRPSTGDGGIDLIRITENGWVVDQIKYFAWNLTAKQKGQIKASFEELRKFAAARGATIAEWHLVLPLDPTKENFLDWFNNELTKDAGYPCSWRGLAFLEGLAGSYPEVVDYYLGNGKERVEELIAQILTGFGLVNQASGAEGSGRVQPLDTVEGLQAIYSALNAHDPHFRYSFSVDHEEVDLPANEPFLVAAVRTQAETAYVTFKIHARFADVLNLRPVPVDIKVSLAEGNDTAGALEDYTRYGTPISITSGEEVNLEISIDLPGGLGGAFTSGTANLGPLVAPEGISNDLRMQILDQNSQELVIVRLKLDHVTAGYSGEGKRWVGNEESGLFEIEIRSDMATQAASVMLRGREIAGRRPAETLNGLRAMAAFHAPNQLRFAQLYGPITGAAIQLDPRDADFVTWMAGVVRLIEALVVIQEHTPIQIAIPDLADITDEIGNELIEIARVLSIGQEETTWSGVAFECPAQSIAGSVDYEAVGPASFGMPLVARLGSLQVPLGQVQYDCASVRLASLAPTNGDRVRVSLVPGPDPSVSIRYLPEA